MLKSIRFVIWWFRDRWYFHQRQIDLETLWPACKERAFDMDHAKAAFAVHAYKDPAWLWLGKDEIARRIEELK